MEAFVKAQAEFPSIHKDKTATIETKKGGQFSYSYADLPTILEQVNPVLKKHGFAVGQAVVSEDGNVGVETRIYHKSGHVEAFGPLFLPSGDDARSAGSAVTYARRYSLCAALGIATDEDDDGAAASRPAPERPRSEPVSTGDPHCPACLAENGELVAVHHNTKKPYWKCTNPADKCAGVSTDKDGKAWAWSGWHESWQASAEQWLTEHGYEGVVQTGPQEINPAGWLANAVQAFKHWDDDQRRGAYKAVMEEAGIESLDSAEAAKTVFEGMAASYHAEFPGEAPF
jgi:hypothetical protein